MSICAVASFEDGILCKLFLHFYIFKYQIESKILLLWRQAFRLIPKNEISFCFRYYCDRNSLQRTIWGYRRLERIQGNSSIENHDCIFHLIITWFQIKIPNTDTAQQKLQRNDGRRETGANAQTNFPQQRCKYQETQQWQIKLQNGTQSILRQSICHWFILNLMFSSVYNYII